MTIKITYELPTANGNLVTHMVEARTYDKAEEICKACERLGYKIKDVTRTK